MAIYEFAWAERPNRMVKSSTKNEDYHVQYARWVFSQINQSQHQQFVWKSIINWAFYKGDQWIFAEDLDPFLLDESGEVRNRIKFVQNIIRPYVEFYTGSIIRMDMSASVVPVSGHAVDRKELALSKLMFMHKMVAALPQYYANSVAQNFPIGETEEETVEIFQNLYKDQQVEDVNAILEYITDKNDIEDKKVILARHCALDGISILREDEKFGEQVIEVVNPRHFFFDRTAKRPDLKDSEYMGEWDLCSVADIVEKYPDLPMWKVRLLEKASQDSSLVFAPHSIVGFEYMSSSGKIPRYRIFWRDIELDEWGIVLDANENPLIVNLTQSEEYTEKDLIKEKDLKEYAKDDEWIEKIFKMKNKKVIPCDIVRYCDIVLKEFVPGAEKDLVLGYGIREFQNKYSYQYNYPDWPYKCYCWSYINGEILSPIDDLISPQRFLNRLISMGESQINNFRGSNVFYDKDIVPPDGGEEEMLRSMNLGKPIGVNANGQLNNSVIPYGNDIGNGTLQLFNVAQTMKQMAESIIGGGEALMGQGGSYRASATVAQQNLTQGTTMQEPVFYAVNKTILQTYESMANRGRRILSYFRSKLNVVVGDKSVRTIYMNREYDLEQFRVKLVRSANPQQERQAANDMLIMLLERQLINQDIFAEYYDKTTLAGIGKAIRQYSNFMIEQARMQAKQAQQQAQQQADAMKAEAELTNLQDDMQMQMALAGQQQQQGGWQQSQGAKPTSKQDMQVSYGEAKLFSDLAQSRRNL